jgi:hypothetical protein
MVITSGRVVEGKIVIDGDPLPEGTTVTVLTREGDESFERRIPVLFLDRPT